jgi:hypothetical protein
MSSVTAAHAEHDPLSRYRWTARVLVVLAADPESPETVIRSVSVNVSISAPVAIIYPSSVTVDTLGAQHPVQIPLMTS